MIALVCGVVALLSTLGLLRPLAEGLISLLTNTRDQVREFFKFNPRP